MYSWLVTVLLLASAAYCSGGAQVPITSYVCTPIRSSSNTHDADRCNVSRRLRTCETKEGVHPALLNGDTTGANGVYVWASGDNPFVVLDIPQGWCVGSVRMTFVSSRSISTLRLSVHSAERLSNNTNSTMFSISERSSTQVVMNLTTLACVKYFGINMTSGGTLGLTEIAVFDTGLTTLMPSSVTASPTSSARPTTTTIRSSIFITTPMSSKSGTNANSTTSGPVSTPPQSSSIPTSDVPVVQDNYVLPAAISVVAVLLVVVLIAIFVVVICIVTRRHNIRKSIEMHRPSIHYRSALNRKSSDITFKDDHLFVVSPSAEVPSHDANGAVDKSHDDEIRDAPRNYAALGPSESNHNVVQGAAGEPMAEGDVSRPASQASIHSNEVSSKLTYGKVTWVHPSTLDHPYDNCNREITVAVSGGGEHYEPPPRWEPEEGPYDLPPDCRPEEEQPSGEVGKVPPVGGGAAASGVLGLLQECQDELSGWHQLGDLPGDDSYDLPPGYKLSDKVATTYDSHKVLKDATATGSQGDTTRLPPPQAPSSALLVVDTVYDDTIAEAPDKRGEPDPLSPTYASVGPPSSSPMPAAAQPSKRRSPPKPPRSAKSPSVPQEDHVYSVVDKSSTKPVSSASSPPARLTHNADAACVYSVVDKSSKKSVTSAKSPPARLTHDVDAAHVYSEVDMSRKKSVSSETSRQAGPTQNTDAPHVYSEVDDSRKIHKSSAHMDALDDDFWGGSGTAEGDAMAQPESITSSITDKGAVPTQAVAMGNVYAEVDYSRKKKSKKSKKK